MARPKDVRAASPNPHEQLLEECGRAWDATGTRGTVVALHRLGCTVESESARLECKREKDEDLCVGDAVTITAVDDARGVIDHRLPRRSWYYRGLEGGRRVKSVTANMDAMAIVVSPAEPETPQALIDRFLVLATLGRMHPVICLNKVDLIDEKAVRRYFEPYAASGAACLALSALEGRGIDALRTELNGKRTVFCGHSGVGKSTLINAMVGDAEHLRTGDVSAATGKGTHTTTWVDWIRLDARTVVVDTPGIKHISLGMLRPADIADGFAEFGPYVERCRFENCLHQSEPDCAVRAAVESGAIHTDRYERYLAIQANP